VKAALVENILAELEAAGVRGGVSSQSQKKNYAERLSRLLATKVANGLRPSFSGILPDKDGARQESRARTSKGFKKLDVNYSTPELGLGLGVSIKTVNFVDKGSARYTKNYTRIDGELRAEAEDYHERQPYAVLIALIFLPADCCDDGKKDNASSFASAVRVFRNRANRTSPKDNPTLMEGAFIGIYEPAGPKFGKVHFFDVMSNPPKRGRPKVMLSFGQLVQEITKIYDQRNKPAFTFEE
jgi:hypothetical protein